MKLPQSRIARRGAFTLIELLVVITIIAVLVSLLLAAVFKAFATAKMVQNRNDITQLEAAIANFKQTFGVDYLPSNLNPQDPNTPTYLARLYPQAPPFWLPQPLKGNQCLVFFLGGPNGQGFSSDPTQPLRPPFPSEQRKGPFFDFQANRLVPLANGMAVYLDVYGTPFAYFSTTGTTNSYSVWGNDGNSYVNANTGKPANCPRPYQGQNSPGFLKPDTFQIISAGANMQFNQGNFWPVPLNRNSFGFDDISNFATGPLGSGQ